MSGSKRFAQLAQQLIKASDQGVKERGQRWRARQKMQNLEFGGPQQAEGSELTSGGKDTETQEQEKTGDSVASLELSCACGDYCDFSIILANLSRVLWIAYEEYELLHACYARLFTETRRSSLATKVEAYWDTFVLNPRPPAPHKHPQKILAQCRAERDAHLLEKSKIPIDSAPSVSRSLISRLLDPFSFLKCRCLRCANLDSVMDYRVALFSLLAEYCELFEDYASLFWCSEAQLSESGQEVELTASGQEIKMLRLMMAELYTAMSFAGKDTNVMKSLSVARNLIYR